MFKGFYNQPFYDQFVHVYYKQNLLVLRLLEELLSFLLV